MLNKRELTEADIRTKFITPAIEQAGWDKITQFREEVYFTDGPIIPSAEQYLKAVKKLENLISG
ncbi:MAG: hypothetical protein HQ534_02085 [Armatimonadetes bacterium]|nr:hypothetical protein [Armatimonadota bacterium]